MSVEVILMDVANRERGEPPSPRPHVSQEVRRFGEEEEGGLQDAGALL